jgi:polysaccharide export outer membrane protein
MKISTNIVRLIGLGVIAALMSACSLPGVKRPSVSAAEKAGFTNVSLVDLTSATALEYSATSNAESPTDFRRLDGLELEAYRVGPHDVLDIVIWGRPELNNPGGMTQTAESRGRKVRADGTLFFPFVGVIHVAGQTVEEIRSELTQGLDRYIKNPQVDVRVSIHQARKYYVTGAVHQPGIQYVESQPKSLLDAISAAGGMTDTADLSTVLLTRGGEQYSIDLDAVYSRGDVTQNLRVRAGDTINVPDNHDKKVFVLGEVEKQATIPMHRGRLTLAEALAGAEGVDMQYANARGIYVLRNAPHADEKGNVTYVFRLNAKSPEAILVADAFALAPRDVVFVSTLGLTRWNRVVTQILPTVQTIFQTDTVIQRR